MRRRSSCCRARHQKDLGPNLDRSSEDRKYPQEHTISADKARLLRRRHSWIRQEGTGRDVDEDGGDLNIYFSTSTYPPHILLTFCVVARSTAEVKSYDFGEGYGQG